MIKRLKCKHNLKINYKIFVVFIYFLLIFISPIIIVSMFKIKIAKVKYGAEDKREAECE